MRAYAGYCMHYVIWCDLTRMKSATPHPARVPSCALVLVCVCGVLSCGVVTCGARLYMCVCVLCGLVRACVHGVMKCLGILCVYVHVCLMGMWERGGLACESAVPHREPRDRILLHVRVYAKCVLMFMI